MCLAIPALVTRLEDDGLAEVDILGVKRQISVDLTPTVQPGQYVLVHAGFSIEIVDERTAQETIDLIKEFPELAGDDLPNDPAMEGAVQTPSGGSMGVAFFEEFGDVPKVSK
ncbi:MAG: HypC/HybG/HupF family hydrogenase formation chaperone [Eggerthellaceae bacterium]|nr:HypC/HybG/HupF family hydrogenase formation chaperone [Eggerthellaceae bacterium]